MPATSGYTIFAECEIVTIGIVVGSGNETGRRWPMWFVYFVLVMATVVSLSLFGWATYLEESDTRAVSPIGKPAPLPRARPRQQIDNIEEVVTVPKTASVARKAKHKQHRRRWVD